MLETGLNHESNSLGTKVTDLEEINLRGKNSGESTSGTTVMTFGCLVV